MIIKKFTAKTEEEALIQAKAELGDGIVIMNVKTAAPKGFFSFLKKPQTEVTVAKEEESERYPAAGQKKKPEEVSLKETFRQVARAAGTEAPPLRQPEVTREPDESHNLLVEKLDSLQTMIEKRLQEEEEPEPEEAEEDSEMVRFMKLLYNTMLDNEVDEKYANQLVDEMERSVKPNQPFDHALAEVYQKMILKFGKAMPIEKGGKSPRIVFFVGPTGVGKTTTIAKIASRFRLEQKRKIALFTADTYRIAAVEQLRTYANILEVPFRVIYSEDEVKTAVREFADFDYIFVDTMGHSHKNEEQLGHMKKLFDALKEAAECQTFLVLSATTKYRDLLKIVSTYKGIADFQLIFTKLDETAAMGNLLNMRLFTEKPLAFVTNGQNVPNDIEQFNPQKTVKQILSIKQEKQ